MLENAKTIVNSIRDISIVTSLWHTCTIVHTIVHSNKETSK